MTAMFPVRKVVCGISGGVDSSVAALLLKRKGYDVLGVFMRNWDIADETGHCSIDKDKEDAEYVCRKIGIPLQEVNFVRHYWNEVFSDLIEDYQNGLTPNPDILCNKSIKFNIFYDYATENLGADAIATGHYARTSFGEDLEYYQENKRVRLLKAVDGGKDQTFFLSQVPQKSLQRTLFPLGGITKNSVKKIALHAGLNYIAKKKESTGICFIGKRNFQDFIKDYVKPKPGNFVDVETGEVVGTHAGIHFWTMGQRCHIPGLHTAYFVADKDMKTQDILVASLLYGIFL
ncbi:mitochondrial tRNA-specific 2-thiouridylase 1-like [Limulus polyphemus]|uniref:tRNA-5-taurinomethyluridine 2-sulfurtransferase n=1 Tax=Limulus polyphemus TaxID=6850 RepID=A0ABM1TBF3_LIMPO|nr:mitochondrial tRNA-specific 2-thiouridylase 1-like [Limulus polyphemus]